MVSGLDEALTFVLELDRLKSVERRTPLLDGSRCETDAEHSWHVATAALALADYAPAGVSLPRVIAMLLIHDIVEIDAGDTPLYEEHGDQEDREQRAADRLFGLLPQARGAELRALWDEFEAGESADARFARALDRFMPLLHDIRTGGGSWTRTPGLTVGAVRARVSVIERGSPELWAYAQRVLDEAVERGYLLA
ncbi:MAG: HD domain-containing protein [Solirubrobacteraceae bacterium]|nr:HD domain-containing protein [Solirubrobacteraceae bacterium]